MSNKINGKDESFWLDYLEDELDPSLKEDVELLLKHSEVDQKIIAGYDQLKDKVSFADPINIDVEIANKLGDKTYNDQLHSKIMAGVEQITVDSPNRVIGNRLKNQKGKNLTSYLMLGGMLSLLIAVFSYLPNSFLLSKSDNVKNVTSNENEVIENFDMESLKDGIKLVAFNQREQDTSHFIMGVESDSDIMLEAISGSSGGQTIEEAHQLIDELFE